MLSFIKNKINLKRSFFILAVLFFVAAGTFVPIYANAQGASPAQTPEPGWIEAGIISATGGIISTIAQILLTVSSWLVWAAGILLKEVIEISINQLGPILNSEGINVAWHTFRDLANMAFIFIILYIAINTILSTDKVNLGKTLTRVIIVAILLNFSFFFTKVAVDASNIASVAFYNQIIKTDCTIDGTRADDIGAVFMCKMGITNFWGGGILNQIGTAKWGDVGKVAVVGVMGSIFFLIAAFVFFAAAIMFIARFVAFIFLFVLSPLAFGAMALPKDKYSDMWKDSLFKNCIFAPAFMLMIWLTLKILSTITNSINPTGYNNLATVLTGVADGTPTVNAGEMLLNYAVVIGMIIASLIVAKQFGAYGAKSALGRLQRVGDWTKGKIIGTTLLPARLAGQGVSTVKEEAGRRLQYRAGRIAERIQKSDSRAAKLTRAVPGVTTKLGEVGASARKLAEEARSPYKNLSEATLRNLVSKATTGDVDRTAIINILAERGNLKTDRNLTSDKINRAAENQKAISANKDVKEIRGLQWQYAETPAELASSIAGTAQGPNRSAPIAPAAVEKLDLDKFFAHPVGHPAHNPATHTANSPVRQAMYQKFNASHIQTMMNRADDAVDRFFTNLNQDLIQSGYTTPNTANNSIRNLINWLESPAVNNKRLASWARSNGGEQTLQGYGFV